MDRNEIIGGDATTARYSGGKMSNNLRKMSPHRNKKKGVDFDLDVRSLYSDLLNLNSADNKHLLKALF